MRNLELNNDYYKNLLFELQKIRVEEQDKYKMEIEQYQQ